jgi:membrane associated rhomboid family serine protease
VVIVLGYAIQALASRAPIIEAFAFSPSGLAAGQWPTLVTALFLHGSWAHALMNAGLGLAFGAPLARFFGMKMQGVLVFFAFYLVTGVIGNLAFAALHWGAPLALVGASGAVSGLMGGASRLIAGRGQVGPLWSRPVAAIAGMWAIINVGIAIFGSSLLPGAGEAGVGWEAHLGGLAAGLLLIGPFAWLAPRPRA